MNVLGGAADRRDPRRHRLSLAGQREKRLTRFLRCLSAARINATSMAVSGAAPQPLTAQEALAHLVAGNERFVRGKALPYSAGGGPRRARKGEDPEDTAGAILS